MRSLHHPAREDIMLPAVLHALSDPLRLRLVAELHRTGEMACGDFDAPVGKSTVSHHARMLREAGVTRVRVQGTQRILSIRKDDMEARFPGLLTSILRAYEASAADAEEAMG